MPNTVSQGILDLSQLSIETNHHREQATRRCGQRHPCFPELAERGGELDLGVHLPLLPHCGHGMTGRLVPQLLCLPIKL